MMKKKGFLWLALLLCVALAMPGFAEGGDTTKVDRVIGGSSKSIGIIGGADGPTAVYVATAERTTDYTPGEVFDALIGSAFHAGDVITGVARVVAEPNWAALALDEASRAQAEALLSALDDMELRMGVGKLDDGLRVELAGAYAPQSGTPAVLDGAVNLTLDGMSVESSLLGGERVTAQWETILALCDVPQSTIDQLIMLRDMDWAAVLPALADQLESSLTLAGQIAAPYAQIVADYLAGLEIETETDVPAEGDFPAVTVEHSVLITAQSFAGLLETLTTRLEADTTLCALLDMAFAQANLKVGRAPLTTARLCEALHEGAAALAQENASLLLIYSPAYVVVAGIEGDAIRCQGSVIFTENETQPTQLICRLMTYDASNAPADGMELILSFSSNVNPKHLAKLGLPAEPQDANAFDLAMSFAMLVDGETMTMDYTLSQTPITTAEGQPGYAVKLAMDMTMPDDEGSAVYTAQAESARTATGGEYSTGKGKMDVTADGQLVPIGFDFRTAIEPSDAGFTGEYTFTYAMPEEGFDRIGLSCALDNRPYDPQTTAALTELALEALTTEEMDALLERVETQAAAQLAIVFAQLPPEVLDMLGI